MVLTVESPQLLLFHCSGCGRVRSFSRSCCGTVTIATEQGKIAPLDTRAALPEGLVYDRLVGVGGFADVHLVRNEGTDENQALKVLRRDLFRDPTAERSFVQEAEMWLKLGILSHVVQALDVVRLMDGRLALLLEYIDGPSLSQIIRGGRLDPHLALKIAMDAARGLLQLHERGLVHGDLHPGNILVPHGQEGTVSDFGLATWAHRRVERSARTFKQSPVYVAPELVAGNAPTPASDIYSFGVILYHALVGRLPYSDEVASDPSRVRAWHLNVDTHLLGWSPAIEPPDVASILARCLRRHPRDRYSSFKEVWEALRSICDREGYTGTYDGYLNGLRDEAEEMLRLLTPMLTARPEKEGLALQKLGKHEQAIEAFDEALKHRPDSSSTFWNKGNSHWSLGQHEHALVAFETARSLDPSMDSVGFRIALCQVTLNQFENAFRELNACMDSLDPEERTIALRLRLRCACFIGEYEKAWSDFAELTGHKAAPPMIDFGRDGGSILEYADKIINFLDENAEQLNSATTDDEAFGQYAANCLVIFRALDFEKERYPRSVEARLLEARVCKRLHLDERASVAIDEALTIDPGHRVANLAKGWHLLQSKLWVEAEAQFAALLRKYPGDRSASEGLRRAKHRLQMD
jgi:serine/threonine protein kinase